MNIPHGPLSSANFIQNMARNTGDKRIAQALTAMSVLLVGLMIYREAKGMISEGRGHADRLHRPHHHSHAPHDFDGHGRHGHVERLEAERGHHGHSHER